MGSMSIGENSIRFASVDNTTIRAIYFGHTLIYIYIGYTLLDADENILCDSDGNNLMCL